MDYSGHARIADFGHATLIKDEDSMEGDSDLLGYTLRWTAPEILNGQATASKESDIFSFAMVMIEVFHGLSMACRVLANCCSLTQVFTDMVPFAEVLSVVAMLYITQGRRPPQPTHPGVTGGLWKLMQRCWDYNPQLHPEVSEILLQILSDLSVSHSFW